jgi:hypothetical protein
MNNENDQTPEATPSAEAEAAIDQQADASAVEAASEIALAEDQAPEVRPLQTPTTP